MTIEACANLSCLSHGADLRYICLHGQTHQRTRYYPKHLFGMSQQYNQHTPEHPWYGTGQGTGNIAIRWTLISHLLITAYQSEATPWRIKSALCDTIVKLDIDTFVDDTKIIHGDEGAANIGDILRIVQDSFRQWRGLLHASGGTLNPPKCSWTPFIWKYNNLGHARLMQPPMNSNLQLTASDLEGQQHNLKINKPDNAVCLLGVHIAADSNNTKELTMLKQKQNKYVQFLLWTPLSKCKAQVIYKQCYLPTVTYPLPATTVTPCEIYNTQLTATSIFLTRMGYPCHLPRCVVYAPETVGGLGICHLGQEQGVQQTLQLLRHMRANTTNGQLHSMTIDQYQITAGTQQPILEDTQPLPWISHGWISSICRFLYTNSCQVQLQSPWTPTPR